MCCRDTTELKLHFADIIIVFFECACRVVCGVAVFGPTIACEKALVIQTKKVNSVEKTATATTSKATRSARQHRGKQRGAERERGREREQKKKKIHRFKLETMTNTM